MLVYQAMGDEHILSLFQASTKDEIIRQIEAMKDEYVQAGTVAKKLVYEKGALYIA